MKGRFITRYETVEMVKIELLREIFTGGWAEFLPEIGLMPIAGETMERRPCRNHSSVYLAKVVLAPVQGEKTLS